MINKLKCSSCKSLILCVLLYQVSCQQFKYPDFALQPCLQHMKTEQKQKYPIIKYVSYLLRENIIEEFVILLPRLHNTGVVANSDIPSKQVNSVTKQVIKN